MACLGGTLGALDDAADGAVEEGVYGVVEEVEGREGVLAPVLDALRCLLEAGEHGALSAGEVFAGVAVLADLGKDFLHEDELVGDEGEGPRKFGGVSITADVLYRLGEAEDVFQDGVVLPIEGLQCLLGGRCFPQDAFLDDFICRCRGEGEACLEPRLYPREFVFPRLDDLVDGLLPGADDPDFAMALCADGLHERL